MALLDRISEKFAAGSHGLLKDCIGAADGWLPEMYKPPIRKESNVSKSGVQKRRRKTKQRSTVDNSNFYMCYKGYFAINVQAVVGPDMCATAATVHSMCECASHTHATLPALLGDSCMCRASHLEVLTMPMPGRTPLS